MFLLCEYFQQFPKTSIYWLPQVCSVWYPIPDKATNSRYSIFKVICDLCGKVVTKQNKSIICFCCWLHGLGSINWKFCISPSVVLKVGIDVFMPRFFFIIRNSQTFSSEDYAYKKLKWEFVFEIRNIGARLQKLIFELMLEIIMQWKVLLACYWKAFKRKVTFENVIPSPNYIFILAIEHRNGIFTLHEITEAV